MQLKEWQTDHKKVIEDFLQFVNKDTSDFILKGGTALMECYGLSRFSEDIDFNGKSPNIEQYVKKFCEQNGYSYRIAKDTNTTKRYYINYGNEGKPLKVETSYRPNMASLYEITKINGLTVYTIDELAAQKAAAYVGRDKIRDLYDVTFIVNNHYNQLNSFTKARIEEAFAQKGLENFDYITQTQKDDLINIDQLTEDFLQAYDKVGLLLDDEIEDLDSFSETPKPLQEQIQEAKALSEQPEIHIDKYREAEDISLE